MGASLKSMVSGWVGLLITFLLVSDIGCWAEATAEEGQNVDQAKASWLGSLLGLERRNLRADKEDQFWATRGKRSSVKPNGFFLSMPGKKSMKPNGLFGSMPGKRAFKPNGLFGTIKKSYKRSGLKPNGLFGTIKRQGLNPNVLLGAFKRSGFKPNGLFGTIKRAGLKPNGLFGAYKRYGLFGEYKRADGEHDSFEDDIYDPEYYDIEDIFNKYDDEENYVGMEHNLHDEDDTENGKEHKEPEEDKLVEKREASDFWAARGKKEDAEFWATRGKRGSHTQMQKRAMPNAEGDFWAVRGKRKADNEKPNISDEVVDGTEQFESPAKSGEKVQENED